MTEANAEERPVRFTVLRANGTTESYIIGADSTPIIFLSKEELIMQGTDLDVLSLLIGGMDYVTTGMRKPREGVH